MNRTSLVSIIVSAILIIGIVVYLARPRTDETENARPHGVPIPAQPVKEPGSTASTLVSCTGPLSSQVPIANLAARRQWAHSLLVSNHVESSLTELRNIATIDPGYPAINLEIAEALIKSRHPSDAKDAMKLQVEISECLANLPHDAIEEYCKAQWVSEPQGGCAAELTRINHQAHYVAGRVDAELTRPPEPRPTSAPISVAPPGPRVVTPDATPALIPAGSTAPAPASAVAAKPIATPPVTPPLVLPPINIKTTEASEHVGELARVCGVIATKRTAETTGKPTFINLDRPFPNQTFTVLVWDKDAPAVGTLPETGSLCVTGTVVLYRGTPEIILYDSKSWSQ